MGTAGHGRCRRWRALRCSRTASSRAPTASRSALVHRVGHAHRAEFAGTRQARQHHGVAPVGLTRSPEHLGIDEGATTPQR